LFISIVWSQSKPLVLEHADSLDAKGRTGNYTLYGNVRIKHDSLVFKTNKARWDTRRNQVYFSGGIQILHPAGKLSADRGFYDRNTGKAEAYGNVEAQDSGKTYIGKTNKAVYLKKKHQLDLFGKPKLFVFEVDSLDATKIDTFIMQGERMRIHDDTKMAYAWENVSFTQGDDLEIQCQEGIFDNSKGKVILKGNPKARMGDYHISGTTMNASIKNKALERILVVDNGHGLQKPKNVGGDLSEVYADTLEVVFKKGKPAYLQAYGQAKGLFYPEKEKENRNKIEGVKIRMNFDKGEPVDAVVSGQAKALYHYFSKEKHLGENEALGDSIKIRFEKRQIEAIEILGNVASGIYYGKEKR
jgi:lipopolysaccharide export system protein LptA